MGGSEDSAAPHEYTLTPELLSDGKHDNSSLPDLKLVENAMYRITLEGTDLAGNTGKKFWWRMTAVGNLTIKKVKGKRNVKKPPLLRNKL